jgi:hypothetical protein
MEHEAPATRRADRRRSTGPALSSRVAAGALAAAFLGVGAALLVTAISAGIGWALVLSGLALSSQISSFAQSDRRTVPPARGPIRGETNHLRTEEL